MSTTRRLGKVTIKLGSSRLESMPGATLDVGGETATTVIGSNEILGPSSAPKQSVLNCTVSHGTQTGVGDFKAGQLISYVFETDTGQVYACGNAWLTNPPVLGNEGWSLVYEGIPCEEVR
ncbi:phage tail tube protein [Luteimonas soli]|uniref:Phage tail tube protein n=1 Tax=Luteimonas soli TaxID=1648966 RepID=A0ABV7XNA3_9GAMM